MWLSHPSSSLLGTWAALSLPPGQICPFSFACDGSWKFKRTMMALQTDQKGTLPVSCTTAGRSNGDFIRMEEPALLFIRGFQDWLYCRSQCEKKTQTDTDRQTETQTQTHTHSLLDYIPPTHEVIISCPPLALQSRNGVCPTVGYNFIDRLWWHYKIDKGKEEQVICSFHYEPNTRLQASFRRFLELKKITHDALLSINICVRTHAHTCMTCDYDERRKVSSWAHTENSLMFIA